MDNQKNARNRVAAIDAIVGERAYQDNKYGPKNDQKNSIGDFLTYIHTYWDDAAYQLTHGDRDGALHTLRKITALGLAAMETHGVLTRDQEDASGSAPAADYSLGVDQFNEFLKGARVAADEPMTGDEPKQGPEVRFSGSAANVPDDVKDMIRAILGDLPPGVNAAHIVVGPPGGVRPPFLGNLFRR